jgi:DNA repair photolyase
METNNKNCEKKSRVLYTIDSFADGISFGQQRFQADEDVRDVLGLALADKEELTNLRSRYALKKENPLHQLELHLMRLSQQGELSSAEMIFGTTTDPFFPFEGKFDASIRFLELFQRYAPGLLTIQTRSPLIVIAMPVLRKLGARASVTIGIETSLEESAQRYTPGLPRVEERLKTAAALRRFGVPVTIQVGPVLPYGDWRKDAGEFAQKLVEHADHIVVQPLYRLQKRAGRKINCPVSQRIARDRLFHYLRPDSAQPLFDAIEKIAPEKLMQPSREQLRSRQLSIFAA